MRQVSLCALMSVFFTGFTIAQPPTSREDAHQQNRITIQPQSESGQSNEISQLKAGIARLQEQLDQLSSENDKQKNRPKQSANQSSSLPTSDVSPNERAPSNTSSNSGEASWRMNADWKNGLQLTTVDEAFRVHVGGRLQFDAGWNGAGQAVQFGPGGIGELQDGALFRQARIRIDGTMYEHIEWVAEFDFANNVENDTTAGGTPIGSPSFANVWIGVNDLPLIGTLRTGWMKEPIGFEHLTSGRWRNFMELPPGGGSLGLHSPGVMLLNGTSNQRVTWAAGFYHAQDDNFGFGIGDGEYAETGRVTWLPWYENDGCQLVHLGIGASHRHLVNDQIDIHGRPSVRTMPGSLEPSLAETGTISGTTQEVLDVELAGVLGPWTLQSEYFCTFIHDAVFPNDPPPTGIPRGTLFYQGTYVELLYFLTGEHRAYDRRTAVFDRVVPLRNFNVWVDSHGWGAWQVGVRYGYLDLQNKGVNGATLNDIVLGLNWFINPNAKIQWNLALDHRDSTPPGSSGWTYIFGARLALDF
jgi:phosphate-selective porin OprO and OprP